MLDVCVECSLAISLIQFPFCQVHLFDIDIPGRIRFQESETLTAGSSLTTFSTPWCRVGLGICYDLRFSDMATVYARQGQYPGAGLINLAG